jgi:predicted dehydrogenase
MACHYMDLPHWALGIRDPLTVEAQGVKDYEGDNDVPGKLRIDYRYAVPAEGIGKDTPVHLTYYQGGLRPEGSDVYQRGSAVLFEGEKGRLLADYGSHRYYFDEKRDDPPAPPRTIPPSPGHQREWIEAVRSRGVTSCNFDYSGALAETVLLGNVAYRSGKKIEWDAKASRVTNAPDAARFLEREYRKGWAL